MPVSQLIRGINLQSGNDACGGDGRLRRRQPDAFVSLMNNYVNAWA
ncbi:hypothetical protein LNP74_04935 [Klebsiella pneumoniae subsp. pneumoniae]|nr:hypothetical protein [Klebsiella pneumoniae subsp. pneumoniae]